MCYPRQMHYEHPDYAKRVLSPDSPNYYYESKWVSHMLSTVSEGSRAYVAVMYPDGWFSVDGDEWWGEFPSKNAAEAYLNIKFERLEEDDGF